MADFGNFGLGKLQHVLDAAADVDKSEAVILQARGRQGTELLDGGLLIGRFVGKGAENDLWLFVRHDKLS